MLLVKNQPMLKEIPYLNDPTNPAAIASPYCYPSLRGGLEPKRYARGQVLNLVNPLDETKGYLLPSPDSPTALLLLPMPSAKDHQSE